MNFYLEFFIGVVIILGVVICLMYFMRPIKSNTILKEPRILNKDEAEFMADYFHNQYNEPDYDGYVGHYNLPKEVMEIYNRKYGKERGFEE